MGKKTALHATCVRVVLEEPEVLVECHIDDRVATLTARVEAGSEPPYEGCDLILHVQTDGKYTARFIAENQVADFALYYRGAEVESS